MAVMGETAGTSSRTEASMVALVCSFHRGFALAFGAARGLGRPARWLRMPSGASRCGRAPATAIACRESARQEMIRNLPFLKSLFPAGNVGERPKKCFQKSPPPSYNRPISAPTALPGSPRSLLELPIIQRLTRAHRSRMSTKTAVMGPIAKMSSSSVLPARTGHCFLTKSHTCGRRARWSSASLW